MAYNASAASNEDYIIMDDSSNSDYVPTAEEVEDYAKWLGFSMEDRDLFWIAKKGINAPLPDSWKACRTASSDDTFYYNTETGESSWEHPSDEYYRNLYNVMRTKRDKKRKEQLAKMKRTSTVRQAEALPPQMRPTNKMSTITPVKQQQQQQQQQPVRTAMKPRLNAAPDEPLPPGWLKKESKSKPGSFYYFNPSTRQTSWYRPAFPERKESRQTSSIAKTAPQESSVRRRDPTARQVQIPGTASASSIRSRDLSVERTRDMSRERRGASAELTSQDFVDVPDFTGLVSTLETDSPADYNQPMPHRNSDSKVRMRSLDGSDASVSMARKAVAAGKSSSTRSKSLEFTNRQHVTIRRAIDDMRSGKIDIVRLGGVYRNGIFKNGGESITLGENGAAALADAIRVNSTVTMLAFYNKLTIGVEGAVELADALKWNSTVVTLDLVGNEIGNKGAAALAGTLKVNRTITTVGLRDNKIGVEGGVALASALISNNTVTTLNLRDNKIRATGAAALAEALKTNTSVTALELKGNDVGDEGAAAFLEALNSNTTLTTVGLSSNNISSQRKDVLKQIIVALKRNMSPKDREVFKISHQREQSQSPPMQEPEEREGAEPEMSISPLVASTSAPAVVSVYTGTVLSAVDQYGYPVPMHANATERAPPSEPIMPPPVPASGESEVLSRLQKQMEEKDRLRQELEAKDRELELEKGRELDNLKRLQHQLAEKDRQLEAAKADVAMARDQAQRDAQILESISAGQAGSPSSNQAPVPSLAPAPVPAAAPAASAPVSASSPLFSSPAAVVLAPAPMMTTVQTTPGPVTMARAGHSNGSISFVQQLDHLKQLLELPPGTSATEVVAQASAMLGLIPSGNLRAQVQELYAQVI